MKNLLKFEQKKIDQTEQSTMTGGSQLQLAWDVGYREGIVAAQYHKLQYWSYNYALGHIKYWCNARTPSHFNSCWNSGIRGWKIYMARKGRKYI